MTVRDARSRRRTTSTAILPPEKTLNLRGFIEFRRLGFGLAALFVGTLPISGQTPGSTSPPPAAAPPPPAASAAPPISGPEAIVRSESDRETIRQVEEELREDSTCDRIEREIGLIGPQITALTEETAQITQANASLDALLRLEAKWKSFTADIEGWQDDLTKQNADLTARGASLQAIGKFWQAAPPPATPGMAAPMGELPADASAALKEVSTAQERVAALQTRVAAEEARTAAAEATVQQARDKAAHRLLRRDQAPIWTTPASSGASVLASRRTLSDQSQALRAFSQSQAALLELHALLFLVLAALSIRIHRRLRKAGVKETAFLAETRVLEQPVALSLLTTLALCSFLCPTGPQLFELALKILAIVPALMLLRRLMEPRLFSLLYGLTALYFFDSLRDSPIPSLFAGHCLLLAEIVGGLLLALSAWRSARHSPGGGEQWFSRLTIPGMGLLGIALIASLLGWIALAGFLADAVFGSAYLGVALYAAIGVVDGLILGLTRIAPLNRLHMVENYRPRLAAGVHRVVTLLALFAWAVGTLQLLSLRSPLVHLGRAVLHATLDIGSLHLSLQAVLGFGLAIWGALFLSRLVRFVLEEDVYPRLAMGHGLPYAISTLIHYSILVVVLLMATTALGVDMTKLTILVSALGVGIGFGLQTIINNFVSGIILLFERPIKVGDSIQVDEAIGVVERIGIRASVLRTPDGTEIIVPNGTLISDRVTNWTLSDRRRIIVIPFNVARGPDPAHLIDLFKQTAAAHPLVSKEPPPEVQATALAATLSFQLRVWTESVEQWTTLRSDLVIRINAALEKENITIA